MARLYHQSKNPARNAFAICTKPDPVIVPIDRWTEPRLNQVCATLAQLLVEEIGLSAFFFCIHLLFSRLQVASRIFRDRRTREQRRSVRDDPRRN